MSRILFSKGAKGEIIKKIQKRLEELGFDPQGIDGDYGKNTHDAVMAFQESTAMEVTGELNAACYERLMGAQVPSVRDRALQLTASFEGHGFTLAQGNFDGAGITWGVIGFTLKHGELSKIIKEIYDRDPLVVREVFKDKTDQLMAIIRSSTARQLEFADSISLGAQKVRLAEPWRSAFKRFGEIEEVQALQIQYADRDYFQPCCRTADEFGLKSELGMALVFDIHVQNGGVKAKARDQIKAQLKEHPIGAERDLRVIMANAVADKARAEYREDVRSRKLAIATGVGKVHGALYVLRNWGLDESPYPS